MYYVTYKNVIKCPKTGRVVQLIVENTNVSMFYHFIFTEEFKHKNVYARIQDYRILNRGQKVLLKNSCTKGTDTYFIVSQNVLKTVEQTMCNKLIFEA